jgi:hypothetical protein
VVGNDFADFLAEMGLTQEDMDRAEAGMPEPLAEVGAPYYLSESSTQGLGVFADRDIKGLVGKLKDGDDWYVAGRYINHSNTANTVPVRFEDTLFCYGEVKEGEEITLNYRQVRSILGH